MTLARRARGGATRRRLFVQCVAALASLGPSGRARAQPSDAAGTEPVSGWIWGKGFVTRSADGERYDLRVGLQAALRASARFDGAAEWRNPFFALRPVLAGNLYEKWITFVTTLEMNTSPMYVNDAFVRIQPWDALGVVLGQQSTPFSRHEYAYGPTELLFPDWDLVADYFWTGRDKGITLLGSAAEHHLDYWVGGYLGAGPKQFDVIRGNYQLVTRLALNPQGATGNTEFAYAEDAHDAAPAPLRTSFGVDAFASHILPGTQNFNASSFQFVTEPTPGASPVSNRGVGLDAYAQSSRVMFSAEAYYRRTSRSGAPAYSSVGAWAQAGVLVYEKLVDVAIRGTWADVDVTSGNAGRGQLFAAEIGSTWYAVAPILAVKARYGYGHQSGSPDGSAAIGGAPLVLPSGHVHVATAQLDVTF